jgi:hypothetical protein
MQVALRAAQKEVSRQTTLLESCQHKLVSSKGSRKISMVEQVERATSPVRSLQGENQSQGAGGAAEQQQQQLHAQQQQQLKLKGALRQAMADYQMLLKGMSAELPSDIRSCTIHHYCD